MSEQQYDQKAISREWAAARIVLIVGFIAALGAGGYFAWAAREQVVSHREHALADIKAEQSLVNQEEANNQAGEELCKTALANAKNFGIVPQYAQLTAYTPRESEVKGRYICGAATTATKYAMLADALCRDLKNAQCVALYSVTDGEGAILYKRAG